LDVSECFIDGSFVIAKKGPRGGNDQAGQGTKRMAAADRAGLPVAVAVGSAAPHEVSLVASTLEARFVEERPQRLVGDKAYESDPLDERLAKQGIQMIAPHRQKRKKPATQDGRSLRRYRRRWKVERLFAWVQNFRRITVRYERHLQNYLCFVQLGCIVILLRNSF
jgi:transposase